MLAAAALPAQAQETTRMFIFNAENGATSFELGPMERDEIGRATLRCSYRMRWAKNRAEEQWIDETFILQTGGGISKFYSQRTRAIQDMLQTAQAQDIRSNPASYKGGDPLTVFQGWPEGRLTLTDSFSTQYYRCEEPMPAMEWTIGGQTRELLGYTCRRADCEFRGRRYTAWFAEEIPLGTGPWKFNGLPGLIMAVADSEGDYSYEITGLERCDEAMDFDRRNYVEAPRKRYLQLKMKFLKDPLGFLRDNDGVNITISNEDGSKNTSVEEGMRTDRLPYDFQERDYEK